MLILHPCPFCAHFGKLQIILKISGSVKSLVLMIFDALANNYIFYTEKLYLFNRWFKFMYWQALWIEAFICNLRRKIKSHVVESQITLLVWPFLLITEKQHRMNHMIIFNDLISKLYQCSIQGFCRSISMFFSICLIKKCRGN